MSRENHDVKTAPSVHGSWPSTKPMAAAALQNGLPGDHLDVMLALTFHC